MRCRDLGRPRAGSVALVGFGLDSVVEVSSGLIILWQFRHALPESRERTALQLLGSSFFVLAGYVAFESVLLCTYLSAALLIGLILNAVLGWYWADPLAGLVIAGVAAREGVQAWRGNNCCAPPARPSGPLLAGAPVDAADDCCLVPDRRQST